MSDDVAKDEAPAIYRLVLLLVVGTSFSFFSSKRFRERERVRQPEEKVKRKDTNNTQTPSYIEGKRKTGDDRKYFPSSLCLPLTCSCNISLFLFDVFPFILEFFCFCFLCIVCTS